MPDVAPPSVDIYDISSDKPVLGTIAPEEVESAIGSGNYSFPKESRVPVISPDGTQGDIDPTEAPAAFQQGYKYATPALVDEATYGTTGQEIATGLEGISQSVAGPLATATEVGLGISTPQAMLKRQQVNPGIHGLGEAAGFIGGAFTGGSEASLIAHIGEGAAEALGVTSRLGAGVLKGAVETSVMAGLDEASKAILQDPNQSVGSAVADIGLAGILGGAIGTVSPLWSATKEGPLAGILGLIKSDSENAAGNLTNPSAQTQISPLLKKALTTFGGVAPQDIDAYVANHEAINAAPGYEDLYNHALEHINGINDDLDTAKSNLSTAKSDYKTLEEEVTQGFKEQGYDARYASSKADDVLEKAQQELTTTIQQNALSKAPAIANATQILRDSAVAGSHDALDLLEQSGKQVSLKPLFNQAREFQDKIFSMGDPVSLQQAETLGKWIDTVGAQYGEKTDASFAKRIVQGLDKSGKYNFNATQFESGLTPYYNQMRHTLDSTLKDAVPEYKSAMKPVAEKFELLNNLSKYGTPDSAVKGIIGLKSTANFTNEMPFLRELEQKVGIKFTQDLDPYASKAIRQLKMNALPEYAKAEKLSQALEYYKHPATYETLIDSLREGPEFEHVTDAQKALENAQNAKSNLGPISEASLQSKMNTTMSGKSIANRELLNNFPGFQGMSIPEILDLIKTRQAFEKGAQSGSRNVNLFATMGAGAGAMLGGGLGAAAGGGAGGMLGGFVDKEGPQLVKKALDKYLSHFGDLPKTAGVNEAASKMGIMGAMHSGADPNPAGFKSSVDYMQSVANGLKVTSKAAKALFTSGAAIIPQHLIPKDDKLEKLDKQLSDLHQNQSKLFGVSGDLGHYMPDHASAVASTAMNAVNLANVERPQNPKQSPLDGNVPLTKAQKSDWNRTLTVAQQPLMLMQHIKDGTLLPTDINTVRALYPSLYTKMAQEITNSMTEHIDKGESIPYHMRQSLSLFLGQPLDSTMRPHNIMAAQGVFAAQQQAQQPQTKPKRNTSKLGGISKQYQTAEQGAQSRQSQPS